MGNIHRYWVVLLLGDIFCCSDTQYSTNQRAVSTIHMPVNDYLVPLLTCTLTDTIVCLDTVLIRCCLLNTIIVIIIEFWDFLWSVLCSTHVVLVSVLGTGIARGQYYWVLDIGCLSWYRSNPNIRFKYRNAFGVRNEEDQKISALTDAHCMSHITIYRVDQ